MTDQHLRHRRMGPAARDQSRQGFLELAEQNAVATQQAVPAGWAKLSDIHDAYWTLIR